MKNPHVMLVVAVLISPLFAAAVLIANTVNGIIDAAYTLYDFPRHAYEEARAEQAQQEVDGE